MSNQPTQSNPWLQLALKAKELITHEPPTIQTSLRRMERKIYPGTAKALFQVGRRAA